MNHDREVDLQARLEVLEVVLSALVLSHRDTEFIVDRMQRMFTGNLENLLGHTVSEELLDRVAHHQQRWIQGFRGDTGE